MDTKGKKNKKNKRRNKKTEVQLEKNNINENIGENINENINVNINEDINKNINENINENDKIKICLNMIVKNESRVIKRCIESIVHLLDAIVISDTGSEDNTIEIIEDLIKEKGLKGEVCKNKWVNFGHNRTQALRHAESIIKDIPGTWYILFMDADDLIIGEGGNIDNKTLINLDKSKLDKSKCIYYIDMKCGTLVMIEHG